MAVIELSGGRIYRGGRVLIDDVSLSIEEGSSHAIVGANGSGKSTLLLALLGAGFLSTGTLAYEGVPFRSHRDRARVRSFVGQAHDAHDDLLAGEAIELYAGRPLAHDELLFGVADLTGTHLGALSAGQRSRVFLSAAIACAPRVLLLDEPAAFLDTDARIELLEALADMRQRGTAVVMVSHDAESILPASSSHRVEVGRLATTG